MAITLLPPFVFWVTCCGLQACRDRGEVRVGDDQPATSGLLAEHRQPRGNAVDRLAVDGLLDLDPVADDERFAVAGRDDVAELGPGGLPGKGLEVARLVVASAVGAEKLELLGQNLVDHRRIAGEQRVRPGIEGLERLRLGNLGLRLRHLSRQSRSGCRDDQPERQVTPARHCPRSLCCLSKSLTRGTWQSPGVKRVARAKPMPCQGQGPTKLALILPAISCTKRAEARSRVSSSPSAVSAPS